MKSGIRWMPSYEFGEIPYLHDFTIIDKLIFTSDSQLNK